MIGLYYNGGQTLPTFTATVTKNGVTSSTASSNLVFISNTAGADGTGGIIWYVDGSGTGGKPNGTSGNGVNGAGDNDTITGTSFNDVIFGDGSGGGEGLDSGSGAQGVAGRGGGGSDVLNGGAGNDIIFGDGFAGTDISYAANLTYNNGSSGGYGGGGSASSNTSNIGIPGSIGGGGGGFGLGQSISNPPATANFKGQTNTVGIPTLTTAYETSGYSYGSPGTGVTADGSSSAPSATPVQGYLTKSMYDLVAKNITGTGDNRMFTQVMGDGNDSLDGGAGNDFIMGGYGNDTITGGLGDDVLWGRGGGTHAMQIAITQGSSSPAVTEKAMVTFTDGLQIGESITVAGLTLTATAAATSSALATAFASLINNAAPTITGFTTSGSLSGWTSSAVANSNQVTFTSVTANTNVTDITGNYNLLDNDNFKWLSGDAVGSSVDIIKDFNQWNGTTGDRINVKLLLSGYSLTSTLSQWITSITTGLASPGGVANSTKIVIDVDGPTGTSPDTQTIWLEGVNLTLISGTLDQQLNALKANGGSGLFMGV